LARPNPDGYIILTEQPDGTWNDDWDGTFHVTEEAARESFDSASNALRCGGLRVVACWPHEWSTERDSSPPRDDDRDPANSSHNGGHNDEVTP
jgi:hypothetical protein